MSDKTPTVRASCGHQIPEAEIISLAGQIYNSKRKTHGAGPGRPRVNPPKPPREPFNMLEHMRKMRALRVAKRLASVASEKPDDDREAGGR